jgi:hypothetical protein
MNSSGSTVFFFYPVYPVHPVNSVPRIPIIWSFVRRS